MKYNSERTAFGRHETFPFRYGWLTKGYQALKRNPNVFESDDATVELGVGKNMVASIRYWMRACGMLDPKSSNITPLGDYIFHEVDGADPYLEDEATIWLLHWKLATNAELATCWYWFFNQFHKPQFTGQELQSALVDFARTNVKGRSSAGTLKGDVAVLLRMYCQSTGNTRTPLEEALDSPLSLLDLISQGAGGRSYQSRLDGRDDLPLCIFGFAVAELMESKKAVTLPIEDLMYSRDGSVALGAVFRLTEMALIAKLENLIQFTPGVLEINETAGIHQLYINGDITPFKYLSRHYKKRFKKGVAA